MSKTANYQADFTGRLCKCVTVNIFDFMFINFGSSYVDSCNVCLMTHIVFGQITLIYWKTVLKNPLSRKSLMTVQ